MDKQADTNEQSQVQQMPGANTPAVDGDLPTFFKILAASLAADQVRLGTTPEGGQQAERRHPAQRASKAALAKQARDVEQAKKDREKANRPKRTRVPLLVAAAAILVVSGVMAAMPKGSDPFPEALMGVWESTSERYAERSFELQLDHIIFQQGVDQFTSHPVTGMNMKSDEGGSKLYTVLYDNAGAEYQFSFVYQPDEALIRFKNQPQVKWYKQ